MIPNQYTPTSKIKFGVTKNYIKIKLLKVNESRYKQYGVTQHFSIGQNLLKKLLRKDKY